MTLLTRLIGRYRLSGILCFQTCISTYKLYSFSKLYSNDSTALIKSLYLFSAAFLSVSCKFFAVLKIFIKSDDIIQLSSLNCDFIILKSMSVQYQFVYGLHPFYILNYRRFFLDNLTVLLTVLIKDFICIVCTVIKWILPFS